jgi:hypothetical protein
MSVTAASPQEPAQPAPVPQDHGMQKTIFTSQKVIDDIRAGLKNPEALARLDKGLRSGRYKLVSEVPVA